MDKESRETLVQNIKVMKGYVRTLRDKKYYYFKKDNLD